MNIYYISNSPSYELRYNFVGITKSSKTVKSIKEEISNIPNFCRDQMSITVSELKSYISSGISFFTENDEHTITGIINFDINVNTINILGLCVPSPSAGIGTLLIESVKEFAKINNLTNIKLTCYDNVKNFYTKIGFKIKNTSNFYDSDEDSDDESSKTRYDMEYLIAKSGGTKLKRKYKNKTYKKRKNTKRKNTKRKNTKRKL